MRIGPDRIADLCQKELDNPEKSAYMLRAVMKAAHACAQLEEDAKNRVMKLLERKEQFNSLAEKVAAYLEEVLAPGRETPPEIVDVLNRRWSCRRNGILGRRRAVPWWELAGHTLYVDAVKAGVDRDHVRTTSVRTKLTTISHQLTDKGRFYRQRGVSQLFYCPALRDRLVLAAIERLQRCSCAEVATEIGRPLDLVEARMEQMFDDGRIVFNRGFWELAPTEEPPPEVSPEGVHSRESGTDAGGVQPVQGPVDHFAEVNNMVGDLMNGDLTGGFGLENPVRCKIVTDRS